MLQLGYDSELTRPYRPSQAESMADSVDIAESTPIPTRVTKKMCENTHSRSDFEPVMAFQVPTQPSRNWNG